MPPDSCGTFLQSVIAVLASLHLVGTVDLRRRHGADAKYAGLEQGSPVAEQAGLCELECGAGVAACSPERKGTLVRACAPSGLRAGLR